MWKLNKLNSKSLHAATKVVYARFKDPEAYKCAVHLTSTLLLDRPIIVVPMSSGKIIKI